MAKSKKRASKVMGAAANPKLGKIGKSKGIDFGKWAFLVGLLIAVITGFWSYQAAWVIVALMILGLIVGVLNVTVKETGTFLLAVISLIITSSVVISFGGIGTLTMLGLTLKYIILFMAPAGLVVALQAIYSMARK